MILSAFELANAEIDRAAKVRAAEVRARDAITPQHAAAEAALAADDSEERQEDAPDLDKAFRDAMPGPEGYPPPSAMSPGRGAAHLDLTAGHAAPSPGRQLPGTFSVPRATLNAVDFTRGPLTDGLAAPSPSHLEGP